MTRITNAHLEGIINHLNRITGMPAKPYETVGDKIEPQAGSYHLSFDGGVALHRMSLTPGCTGVSTPLHSGHVTKRELYDQICAYIYGIESVKGE